MAVKKTTKAATGKTRKATASKKGPSHEEIRKKAEEIYYDRIARGADGTAEDDWHLAEKLLKAAKK
jgi:hypothetical protein